LKSTLLLLLLFISISSKGQDEAKDTLGLFDTSPVPHRERVMWVGITEGAIITGSYIWLNELWYADFPKESLHFYNDLFHWQQMDKWGHAMTSYYLGKVGKGVLDWAGLPHEQATWWGGSLGLVYLTGIELLDSFSKEWGLSKEDMAANIFGTTLFIGQELGWKEQRIVFKFSYHNTRYAEVYPALLGKDYTERWLKDYNGQTYWLSANIRDFTDWDFWPPWLNIAAGYGADGMVTSFYNENFYKRNPQFNWQRQFYFSLDVDLRKIPVKNKFLKTVLNTLNFIKFPMPTWEINTKDSPNYYWLYF